MGETREVLGAMFHRLGRYTASHPWLICAIWLVAGAALALVAPRWDTRTPDAVDRSRARVAGRIAAAGSGAPSIYATGAAGVGRDLTRTCGSSLQGTTVATVILVIVVLLLVYRSPLLALIPLCTIALSVW